jgi:hypothetical protein
MFRIHKNFYAGRSLLAFFIQFAPLYVFWDRQVWRAGVVEMYFIRAALMIVCLWLLPCAVALIDSTQPGG